MSENPITKVIQETEQRFVSIAPAHMKYDAEKGFAIQILKNNGYLMRAATESPESLQQAITNIAAIGLSLNPAEKLAYLIPRNVKIKDDAGKDKWVTRIYLEPSYMGLIRLATDSGSIKWAQAAAVYAADEYTDNGPGEKPTHRFNAFAKAEARGEFVGVYCVARTVDGDHLTASMTAEEIHGIRDRSEGWKAWLKDKRTCPWVTDFTEQAKKTVIRRSFKTWPRTDERRMSLLANAVELSNQNEGFDQLLSSPEIHAYTADQKAFFDQLLVSSDAIGMFVFLTSIDEGVKTSLYHSFEKGQKGKYQRIVDELYKTGAASIHDIAEVIEEHVSRNEELGVKENIEGLGNDAMAILRSRLSADALSFIDELA